MNLITKDDILIYLKNNKKYLKKEFGVQKIALFGSFARGEALKGSDIDLLIDVKEKNFRNRYLLKEFLENEFKTDVDVFYFDTLRSFIKDNIKEDLVYA
jgi:uncharacterized protein